jgi:nucleoside-diphosphate-sugar epimerase
MLIEAIPYVKLGEQMPGAVRRLLDLMPILKPVIPDPGVPFQLVHHDDVASALKAAVLGRGEPGVYNLAGDGDMTASDLAEALGWYSIPIPEIAVDATAEVVSRLPLVPSEARWIESIRTPVLMDTGKARKELKWKPRFTTRETLKETVEAARPELQAAAE